MPGYQADNTEEKNMATRLISREPKDPQELYKEALENASAFNSRLRYERRLRIPFIDAQTGIAMNDCHLWISKLERRPGQTPHYIYSYPAKRWRKKKRPPPTERSSEVKAAEAEEQISENMDTMETEGVPPEESEADHTRKLSQ
ncbi:Zinc finger protein ubi-d4 [Desmophyllum pertusum]|uniref:Zinc finger protein ubi-d4 n=1 Tax=Desmophyllum pertusum TaxID=174260 RepID=A0A9X0CIH2_9CNID|nr:Zinc finger protein ubi-d4 [Desmophyllum pertusum]